jgi:MEDS: MEthanogen/methylotroph, DcmR Sensory domain
VAELAQGRVSELRHAALPYASSGELAEGVAGFVETAVQVGGPVLVACAGPGLDLLRLRLNSHGALVTWADMAGIGLNPARLIDMIQLFAGQHRGRVTWCVQEPAWPGRSPEEMREVIRHEALVNLALADMPVSMLCPYDVRLGTKLIAGVERTHPALAGGGRRRPRAAAGYGSSSKPATWSRSVPARLAPPSACTCTRTLVNPVAPGLPVTRVDVRLGGTVEGVTEVAGGPDPPHWQSVTAPLRPGRFSAGPEAARRKGFLCAVPGESCAAALGLTGASGAPGPGLHGTVADQLMRVRLFSRRGHAVAPA